MYHYLNALLTYIVVLPNVFLFTYFLIVNLKISMPAHYKYFSIFSFSGIHVAVTISKVLATMVTTHLSFFPSIFKSFLFLFSLFISMLIAVNDTNSAKLKNLES